jgi:gliding motility-associated lipoprotein GldD
MNFKLVYILIFLFYSCDSVELPKPNAYLRLDFPSPIYKKVNFEANGTTVELNTASTSFTKIKNMTISNSLISKSISYPLINAEIKLEYYNLNGKHKLNDMLKNLNDFTSIHLKKSLKPPKIQEFINPNTKVYASIINIKGEVTSPYQFYATDSVNNLIIGILSLKSKTKYDSVLPALDYLKKDIYHLIESIKWNVNK